MADMRNVTPPWNSRPQIHFDPNWIWKIAIGLLVISTLLSGFSQVPADSVGVVLRFGRYLDTVPPGLRFKLPLGVDQIIVVPVERQLKLEFGFTTPDATNPDQPSEDPGEEENMVTGDLNMALVEWVVQYRVLDAKTYLFAVRSPGATMRAVSESVMREVVGDRTVDEVLTIGRQEIESETLRRMQEVSKLYHLGVSVMQVQLKGVHPPKGVQTSFNEVNRAQQEREQMINVANGQYNKAVPKAKGEADQQLRAAEGYALKRVNEAKGDAARFNSLLAEYIKAPEVTRQRLYLETMSLVLPKVDRKIILDEKAGPIYPLLPLDAKTPAKLPGTN